MSTAQRRARTAGVAYLLLAVSSGLPWWYLNHSIVKSGDAAATTANVLAHAPVLRLALVGELAAMACYVLTALALHALLRDAGRGIAAGMVVFAASGAAVMRAAALAEAGALSIATDGGPAALVYALLQLRISGALVAGVFFGLWLLPLGYLARRSGYFPRALGILLIVGCFSYLVDLVETLLFPDFGHMLSPIVLLPAIVAELWMVGYLLTKGVRSGPAQPNQVSA